MATLYIDREVPDATVAKIRVALDNASWQDVNWTGVEFTIERDDSTWIDCAEPNDGDSVRLLQRVIDIIEQS